MIIKPRITNNDPDRDLMESVLVTVGKKYVGNKPSIDKLKDFIIAEHSILDVIQVYIEFQETDKDSRNQLVRHTKHNPRYYCQSSRPDWIGEKRDPNSKVSWNGVYNIRALLRMANERMCTRTELETRKQVFLLKEAMIKSDDKFLQVIGWAMVPSCVNRMGCPDNVFCGQFNNIAWNRNIKERVNCYNYQIGMGVVE